jgi:hypothetical protein
MNSSSRDESARDIHADGPNINLKARKYDKKYIRTSDPNRTMKKNLFLPDSIPDLCIAREDWKCVFKDILRKSVF